MEFKVGDLVEYKNGAILKMGIVTKVLAEVVEAKDVTDEELHHLWNKRFTRILKRANSWADSPTKPNHYGKLDVFTYAKEHFTVEEVNAYHQITAIKYITRAGKKDGNPYEQDIKKAIVHLEECLKGEEG